MPNQTNYQYLLHRISRHTYTAARMYSKKKTLLLHCKADPQLYDESLADHLIKQTEIGDYKSRVPLLFSVDRRLFYAWIVTRDGLFLLGPTRFSTPMETKLDLPASSSQSVDMLSDTIPLYNVGQFCEDILLICNLGRKGTTTDPYLDENAILTANCVTDNDFGDALSALYNKIFEDVENNFAHNPYSHEKRQVASIREGETDRLSRILEERFPGRYGTLSQDPLKQEIYIGIVETTLASRAAIEGGVHPEIAYSLSDITIQKLDNCKSAITAMTISRQMQMQYAKLVADQKQSRLQTESPTAENNHVSHCKDYIFTHLHGKLTVHEIADAIGLEENYLSALFKRYENVTLSSYITNEKINLAKNLLMYSRYSFIEISNYLGFSSQSHFGQVFKKITGTTPRIFRESYASDDFMVETMRTKKDQSDK